MTKTDLLLNAIGNGTKTYSDLKAETHIKPKTISTVLFRLKGMGYITSKEIYETGSIRNYYSLTEEGIDFLTSSEHIRQKQKHVPKPDFESIVQVLRAGRLYKTLAAEVGITQEQLKSYVRGKIPKGETRKKLIDAFNENTNYYLPYEGEELRAIILSEDAQTGTMKLYRHIEQEQIDKKLCLARQSAFIATKQEKAIATY